MSRTHTLVLKKKSCFFVQKKNLREAGGQKKVLKNIGKGDIKKGPAKGTEKKWSWMVSLYRPWQDPIGQGHGEWNGNREKLYGMQWRCPERTGHGQKH